MEYKVGNITLLLDSANNQKINASWLVLYVRKGTGMYSRGSRLYGLDEGDVFFFPPGSDLAFDLSSLGDEYNASVDATVIRFDEQWLDAFLLLFPDHSAIVLALKECRVPSKILGTKWLNLTRTMDKISSSDPHKRAAVLLDIFECLADPSDLCQIAEAVSPVSDASEKVERIDRYISCNLVRRFTLDDIASYAGMNRTYFCLFFKKHYGLSLTDHVNRLRIDMACSLLRQGNSSVADIARRCGFPTVTYFNRVFKKNMGVSPREF